MAYKTKQIKGKGRGKLLGYPTINLEIPASFSREEGIYAGWVWIGKKQFKGAFHYGPVPTFHEKDKSLEVFLINALEKDLERSEIMTIEFELIERIRDIIEFSNSDNLSKQIGIDIQMINKILHKGL